MSPYIKTFIFSLSYIRGAYQEEGIGVFVMAKKPEKQLSPERKELITKLIDEFDIKSAKDIEDMFKEMFSPMLQ